MSSNGANLQFRKLSCIVPRELCISIDLHSIAGKMLGKVTRRALLFNQKFNNLIKIPHVLHWDPHRERWIFKEPSGVSLLLYCISVSVMPTILLVILTCGAVMHSKGISAASLGFPLEVLILYILIVLFGVEYILQEALLLQFGKDLKNLINVEMDIVSQFNVPPPRGRDWVGIVLGILTTSITVVLTVTPLGFVYFGWDIFTLTTKVLFPHWWDAFQASGLIRVVRALISPLFFQPFALSLRNFFLALVMLLQFALQYFDQVKKLTMSSKARYEYQRVTILLAHLQDFARHGWMMACSCVFFILIFGINLIVFCFRSKNYPILLFTLVILTVATAVFQYALEVDSSFPYLSKKLLLKWTLDLQFYTRKNPSYYKYLRRVIRAFRPVAFKIGSVGVINRELKINFFDAVLIYTVNILVAFSETQTQVIPSRIKAITT